MENCVFCRPERRSKPKLDFELLQSPNIEACPKCFDEFYEEWLAQKFTLIEVSGLAPKALQFIPGTLDRARRRIA